MLAEIILLRSTDDGVWRAQAWTNCPLRRQTEGGKAGERTLTLDRLAASPARINAWSPSAATLMASARQRRRSRLSRQTN